MRLRSLMVLAALFVCTLPMMADTTYSYTGNDFTTAFGSYTRSEFVHGSVTFSGPLTDNLSLGTVTPTSFSFSDGLQTIDDGNTALGVFDVATDANGNITQWFISVFDPDDNHIETVNGPSNVTDQGIFGDSSFAINQDTPGKWSSDAPPPPAVPEPSTLALLGTGVLGLVGAGRRWPATDTTASWGAR